jgi:hypothetical protein
MADVRAPLPIAFELHLIAGWIRDPQDVARGEILDVVAPWDLLEIGERLGLVQRRNGRLRDQRVGLAVEQHVATIIRRSVEVRVP